MDYTQEIYELLSEYLPMISTSLADISDFVASLNLSLSQVLTAVDSYRVYLAVVAFTAVLALILKRRFLI